MAAAHLEQHVQLVLGHHHPQPVAGVHHKDDALVKWIQMDGEVRGEGEDYLAVPVVVLPQVPVPALTGHVEGGEAHVPVWKKNDRNMSRKRF